MAEKAKEAMNLDELERLLREATQVPWEQNSYRIFGNEWVADCAMERDAALICAAVNTLPALLRLARACQAERDAALARERGEAGAEDRWHEALEETAAALAALEAR
jgi:hypothetical protein